MSFLVEFSSSKTVKIDENLLTKLADQALTLCQKHKEIPMASAGELLSQRGVIEICENTLNDDEIQCLKENLLKTFTEACQNLQTDRQKEGAKIKEALIKILKKIDPPPDSRSKIVIIKSA